jgi:L-ascorbate metabolism protein UlaG (beta-lactamase superfamily)
MANPLEWGFEGRNIEALEILDPNPRTAYNSVRWNRVAMDNENSIEIWKGVVMTAKTNLFILLSIMGIVSMAGIVLAAENPAGKPAPDAKAAPEPAKKPQIDTLKTEGGDLGIMLFGHGSLALAYQGKGVVVDPWSRLADYTQLPKADVILITHEHADHLDPKAIEMLRKDSTVILLTQACAEKVPGGKVIKNGETQTVAGIKIEAVPAYNIVQKRPDGTAFHPKGSGNGYVINFGKTRVYVAGDTENIAEMKNLKNIAVAFLPMNLPYTMTPEQAAEAAKSFMPKILYPYHFGETDPKRLVELLKDVKGIEVRIRDMK